MALSITFQEAITGVEKEIALTRTEKCEHCAGNGAEPGSRIITCPECQGTGQKVQIQNTILGRISTSRICPACNGTGKKQEKPCTVCHGFGTAKKTSKIKVKIPAGIADGAVIRLSGKGEAGARGGVEGDLYLHIAVKPDPAFSRHGDDISTEQEIHLLQAVLGDEIKVKTIYGEITLKIPAGTQSGKIFKLKEYGMPKLQTDRKGDHYVKIKVQIPEKLSSAEKKLYAELTKAAGLKIKPTEKSFFEKLW